MENLFELKLENFGVCLNIELIAVEKNAFLCRQIDEDLEFETNQLIIRDLKFNENSQNSQDIEDGSDIEVYSNIMLNEIFNNIHGWQPGKVREIKGNFCLVDINTNGNVQSMIADKKFIRKINKSDEYINVYYDNLKFYKMKYLDLIDEKINERNESNNKQNRNLNIENTESIYDKKYAYNLFLKDLKQIINPYFCFVNLNPSNNYLVINEEIEEDLINIMLQTTYEHFVYIFEREKLMNNKLFIEQKLHHKINDKASNAYLLNKANIEANYIYNKQFTVEKLMFDIVQPKIEFYQNNFHLYFDIKNLTTQVSIRIYSNCLRSLLDSVNDIFIIEKTIELKANRSDSFFNYNSMNSHSLKIYAEKFKILFYEIIKIDDTKLKIKLLGNENNIDILKASVKDYLSTKDVHLIE